MPKPPPLPLRLRAMGFEDEVANAERQLRRSSTAPPVAELPDWHKTLLSELRRAKVPRVAAFSCPRVEVRRRLMRVEAHERRYVALEPGWVLRYTVEYRDGYLTSGGFFVNSTCLSSLYRWAVGGKVFTGLQNSKGSRRTPPHVTITKGLPRGGGWDVTPGTSPTDFWADKGAARIVAILRRGGSLARAEHGSFKTTPL